MSKDENVCESDLFISSIFAIGEDLGLQFQIRVFLLLRLDCVIQDVNLLLQDLGLIGSTVEMQIYSHHLN